MNHQHKTWLEISRKGLQNNIRTIRQKLKGNTKLFAVVKSNAYGHGLVTFSKLADTFGVDGFCVDSVVEGWKLRREGIKKPFIIIGATLSYHFPIAERNNLTLTISNHHALKLLARNYPHLPFHLKVDTGMHRQGFYGKELPAALSLIKKRNMNLQGVYSHLAMPANKKFSEQQWRSFSQAADMITSAIGKQITKHLVATKGIPLGLKYHFDAVRVGMGLYGSVRDRNTKQILSWYSVITEIKKLIPGDRIGYDLTETIRRPMMMAIIPIGYWHGLDRRLSGKGLVMVNNKNARILGRVSMDMIAIDVSGIHCRIGNRVTILGSAEAMADTIHASPYEIITRINPLIKKIVV